MFQLADTWCEGVEPSEYTSYLTWLHGHMFTSADRWHKLKLVRKLVFNPQKFCQ
jgi:hypothetical protein